METIRDPTPIEWLTGVLLGAAGAIPSAEAPISQGTITSPSGQSYQVMDRLGKTDRYTLYQCLLPSERFGVLKIAATTGHNAPIDLEAFILQTMSAKAREIEAASDPDLKPLNYQHFFPELVESFISAGQGGRRISILSYPEEIDTPLQITPISSLVGKERVRVDPRTAAWIFGKVLKVLGFAHDQSIANGFVTGTNILIEREQHGVIIFDWTQASMYRKGRIPSESVREEVAQAARWAVFIMGGNPDTYYLPDYPEQLDARQKEQFMAFFQRLIEGKVHSASEEHRAFYRMVHGFWGRLFHPFTAYPI